MPPRARPAVFAAALLLLTVGGARAQTASLSAPSATYASAAGQVTLQVAINYAAVAAPTALGFTIELPAGWTHVATSGANPPEVRPRAGDLGPLEFAFTAFPPGSVAFTVAVAHPAGLAGSQVIRAGGIYRSPLRTLPVADVVLAPAGAAPVITRHPAGVNAAAGQVVSFSVEASGAELTYQWRKDGQPLPGATGPALSLGAVAAAAGGAYDVVVGNAAGSVTSRPAALVVAPVITAPPASQAVAAGASASFTVTAAGTGPLVYQWLRDGAPLAGATGPALVLPAVAADAAGRYAVTVGNAAGSVTSAAATLTVGAALAAPVITGQPASQAVALGAAVTLAVVAAGVPPPAYQWTRDGVAIAGATAAALAIPSFTAGDAGSYRVEVANAAGAVSSAPAVLSLAAGAAVGASFGAIAGDAGLFALWVRPDRTAVFLGYLRDGARALLGRSARVGPDGEFRFTLESFPPGGPALVAAGTCSPAGAVTGVLEGAGLALAAPARSPSTAAADLAGFYPAGEPDGAALGHVIIGADGVAHVQVQSAGGTVAARGTVTAAGALEAGAGAAAISGALQRASATLVLSAPRPAGTPLVLVGANDERRTEREKLLNLSTRSEAGGAGGDALIAGFVVGGPVPKRVLVRAIGPTLANFGVAGVLPSARLEVFRGQVVVTQGGDWGASAGAGAVAAASARLGAFALDPGSRDAALLVELPPGAYTAVVTGQGSAGGVGLVEVYDADETPAETQRLGNLAARGVAGSADRTLTVGFVVGGSVPKRVLVRGVGPALAAFGVSGALADPRLQVFRDGRPVAANNNWGEGAEAAMVAASATAVGAFALPPGSRDAALVISLFPGAYTAQVTGADDQAGIALVEVYEVP